MTPASLGRFIDDFRTGQADECVVTYGDEFGNLQALEFGDKFLTKALAEGP